MRNRTSLAQRSEPSTWSRPTRSASCLSANSTAKMGPQMGCSSPVKPSNSPLRARRRASMRSGAQEVRFARVRVRTLSPSRKDSRKRMAGGELRLGTAVIYMSVCISDMQQLVKKQGSSALLVNQSWTAPPARSPKQGEELLLLPPAYRPGYPAPHAPAAMVLSLIHISEPTRLLSISYAVFC